MSQNVFSWPKSDFIALSVSLQSEEDTHPITNVPKNQYNILSFIKWRFSEGKLLSVVTPLSSLSSIDNDVLKREMSEI